MSRLILCFIVLGSVLLPSWLGTSVLPMGEGTDEYSHIDAVYFRWRHPSKTIEVDRGLYEPGVAPLGQGHQPPLYYLLQIPILSVILSRGESGPFVDYEAGTSYSSAGLTLGGVGACPIRDDPERNEDSVRKTRRALYALRFFNAFLFGGTVLLGYLCARTLWPQWAALLFALLCAGIPNGLWRSALVNNDNGAAFFSSLVFTVGLLTLRGRLTLHVVSLLALLSAAAFLSKYTAVAALGFSLLVLLLHPGTGLGKKVRFTLLLLALFSTLTISDLLENKRLDGDLFSLETVIHANSFLHAPTSVTHILFGTNYVPELLKRFWVEFHNTARLDRNFPIVTVSIWSWILGIGLIASCARMFFEKRERLPLLYAWGCFLGTLAVIVQFAAKFPLAGGRYLHIAFLPLLLLVFSGWLFLFRRRSLAVAAVSLFSLFGFWLTGNYLFQKYTPCRSATDWNVPSGVDVTSADIDGDKKDELLFFHRARNRLFAARNGEKGFAIVPEWTRATGLMGDKLLQADVTGDGRDDVIFFRPETSLFSVIDGASITQFDQSKDRYSDLAAKGESFRISRKKGGEPLAGDMDQDGKDDLVLFQNGVWHALLSSQQIDSGGGPKVVRWLFGRAGRQPLLIRIGDALFPAVYDAAGGKVLVGRVGSPTVEHSYLLPAGGRLLPSMGGEAVFVSSEGCASLLREGPEQLELHASYCGAQMPFPVDGALADFHRRDGSVHWANGVSFRLFDDE